MKTSLVGRALIESFEGKFLTAYRDSVGVLTIGYGHTTAAGPPVVIPGMTISNAECDALLAADLGKVETEVNNLVKVPLTQYQFDALVSFHFNTGGLGRSTLLRVLNAGLYRNIPGELAKWNRAGGNVLAGLTRRRKAEADLWSREAPIPAPIPPPPDIEPVPPQAIPAPTNWLVALITAIINLFKRK